MHPWGVHLVISFPCLRLLLRNSNLLCLRTLDYRPPILLGWTLSAKPHQENLIFTFWYFLVLFGAFL